MVVRLIFPRALFEASRSLYPSLPPSLPPLHLQHHSSKLHAPAPHSCCPLQLDRGDSLRGLGRDLTPVRDANMLHKGRAEACQENDLRNRTEASQPPPAPIKGEAAQFIPPNITFPIPPPPTPEILSRHRTRTQCFCTRSHPIIPQSSLPKHEVDSNWSRKAHKGFTRPRSPHCGARLLLLT